MTKGLTHLDAEGRARMVDVSDKPETGREAHATGRVRMRADTLAKAMAGDGLKGDVRAVAEIAGVMAAKRTADLIPMCHPIALTKITVTVTPDEAAAAMVVTTHAKTTGPTGVEMEALVAASVACLTIYDMLKALDREMVIEGVALLEKRGGASGDFMRDAPC